LGICTIGPSEIQYIGSLGKHALSTMVCNKMGSFHCEHLIFSVFLGDLWMKLNFFASRSNRTTISQLKCVTFPIQEINCEEMNIWLFGL